MPIRGKSTFNLSETSSARSSVERVKTHLGVPKIIGDKRPTFKQLIIRNYEPPKMPLSAPVAGPISLMDLFGDAGQR